MTKNCCRYKQPPPQESPLQWWIEASGIGCLTHPDAEITGRPTHALMPSHIPSNYGYMFLGWEKIGVRLRYASWLIGRDKEQIASLFLLHPFPWVPTHLNQTSIFSHPQKHIPVNRDRLQVCRGPVEVVACPPSVVLPWDLRWKQSCSTWNSCVQELECYIDSVKRYEKS